jgi:TPR repeat protein
MKKPLLFVLALAVIPVGVDAQGPDLEETRARAALGDVIAQFNLGFMYEDGEGVPEDDVLAYMWYNLAAAQAAFGGAEGKDRLEERMTREQIAEA